jgi:hypothetical protein
MNNKDELYLLLAETAERYRIEKGISVYYGKDNDDHFVAYLT